MAKLIGKNAEVEDRVFPIEKEHTYLGRQDNNDVVMKDVSVSHHHCVLFLFEDQIIAQDQDSTNGVRINGTDIEEAHLFHGDVLEVGDIQFTLDAPEFTKANLPAGNEEVEASAEAESQEETFESDEEVSKEAYENVDVETAPPPADPAAVEETEEAQEKEQAPVKRKRSAPALPSFSIPTPVFKGLQIIGLLVVLALIAQYVNTIMSS